MIYSRNWLSSALVTVLFNLVAIDAMANEAEPTQAIESAREVKPFVVPPGEGDHVWFLGQLGTIKLSVEETGAAYGAVLITAAAGYAPGAHIHLREDESFFLLEGSMKFFAGEKEFDVTPGAFVFSPKKIPHRFIVTSDNPSKWLLFHGPTGDFRRFIEEVGTEAGNPVWPPQAPIPDPASVPDIARKHFIEPVQPAKEP